MKITAQELSVLSFAMRVSEEKNQMGQNMPKLFEKSDELDALGIFKKMKSCIKGEGKDAIFIDSELELTTDEKALLKKCLDRKFSIDELEIIVPLREKLNAPVK